MNKVMGIEIETIKLGNNRDFPRNGWTVICHYTLTLENGKKIDCSRERDHPFNFRLNYHEVIKGWDEAFPKLSKGQRAKLTIPPELGYGAKGIPGAIPPNSTLIYDVELIGMRPS